MIYQAPLLERRYIAYETLSILIQRPESFEFRPGQYVDLSVLGGPHRDGLGPSRSMSIASPPGAPHLEFVMRVRGSAFKRNIVEMPVGTEVVIEGPLDDLRFEHEPDREIVFVAGGVGIAPFLSILRQVASSGAPLPATLFYANRRPADALYLEELGRLGRTVPELRLVPSMTAPDLARGWIGETERPGMALLSKYLPRIVGPAYYLAGSPMLISQLRRGLLAEGVSDTDIGLEIYAGY